MSSLFLIHLEKWEKKTLTKKKKKRGGGGRIIRRRDESRCMSSLG
jgi:hypothetical protein